VLDDPRFARSSRPRLDGRRDIVSSFVVRSLFSLGSRRAITTSEESEWCLDSRFREACKHAVQEWAISSDISSGTTPTTCRVASVSEKRILNSSHRNVLTKRGEPRG
jgi:hypothetical protein